MSCDHELANEWERCSGKNASSIIIMDVAWCCRFAKFVQQCCGRACALVRFSIPNMSQDVATGWPNARSILPPAVLRYVAFNCWDRLASNVGICCVEMLRSFSRGFNSSNVCPVPSVPCKQKSETVKVFIRAKICEDPGKQTLWIVIHAQIQ